MSHCEFNLTVRELSPTLNDCCETVLRGLIDNFAGFAASRIKGHRE